MSHYLFKSNSAYLTVLAQYSQSGTGWQQTSATAAILKDNTPVLLPNPLQEYLDIDLISVDDCLFGEQAWWQSWFSSIANHLNTPKWDKKTKRDIPQPMSKILEQFTIVYNCDKVPDIVMAYIIVNLNRDIKEHIEQEFGIHASL